MLPHSFIYLASQSPRRRQLLDQIGVAHRPLLADDARGRRAARSRAPRRSCRPTTCSASRWPSCRRRAGGWRGAACRRRRSCAPTPRWPLGRRILGKPRRRRGRRRHAAAAVGPHAPRADRGGGERRAPDLPGGERLARAHGRAVRAQPSGATSPAANPSARPAPTPCRAASRPGSSTSTAATPASWACRCSRPPACCRVAARAAGPLRPWPARTSSSTGRRRKRAWPSSRTASCRNCTSSARSSAAWSATSTWARWCACCRACRAPSSTSAWSAPPSCTWPTCWRPAGRARGRPDAPPVPIERQVFEGQTLTVQVIKDAIGTKGARLSTQVSHRRAHAGLPAARQPHRHQPEDRLARTARAAARPRAGAGHRRPRRQGRRLHPAHQRRGSQRRGTGRGHRLPAPRLGADPRARRSARRRARCCTRT